jgi:hypothetical protein
LTALQVPLSVRDARGLCKMSGTFSRFSNHAGRARLRLDILES